MYHLKPKNHIDGSKSVLLIFFSEHLGYTCSAANKGRSRVNYRQSLAFDLLYLSCNNHCDWWLFQENFFYYFQKQPYADILQNGCCEKFCNIHRKTSVLESLFNKVAGLMACNFISTTSQKRLQHRWLADSGPFISRVLPTGGCGGGGESPTPVQNLLIPPPSRNPPSGFPPLNVYPPTKSQFSPLLNSNFQVAT